MDILEEMTRFESSAISYASANPDYTWLVKLLSPSGKTGIGTGVDREEAMWEAIEGLAWLENERRSE